jgi:predicted HTH transcriptional regulator
LEQEFMNEMTYPSKVKRKQRAKAEPKNFHLAQTSLEIIEEIIVAYARKNGSMTLSEIAKEIGKQKTPISIDHAF